MKLKFWIVLSVWLCALLLTGYYAFALDCSMEKPCTFFWNANTEPDIEGYRFYIRPQNGDYPTPLDLKHPQTAIGVEQFKASFGLLKPGNYGASVSAYDKAGNDSGKSVEIPFTFVAPDLPPAVPTLQIFVTVP